MEQEKNYIRFKTIIEIVGKPKEHVEKTLKLYIEKVKEDSELMVMDEYYAAPKPQGNMFSTFAELEIVVKDITKLIGFCFDFMPSSLEVMKPESISFSDTALSSVLNDLQAKLHNVDMVAKQLKNENDFLKRNLYTSLKNTVSIILTIKKSCAIEELSKLSGIEIKELGKFLEDLIKEEKIKKEDDHYSLKLN